MGEKEGRGKGPTRPIAIVGIALIAFGLPLFIIALTVSVPCNDVIGAPVPVCATLVSPVIGLLFLVLGIALVTQSYRLRR